MDGNRKSLLNYTYLFMVLLNLLIILFISATIIVTTRGIQNQFSAREFLNMVDALPRNPVASMIKALSGFLCMLMVILVRKHGPVNPLFMMATGVAEVLLCLFIMFALNLSYNGLILLVIMDLFSSVRMQKNRILLLTGMFIAYILLDYDLISQVFQLTSLHNYISWYDASVRFYLIGMRNILVSVNIVVFILHIFLLMQNQRAENQRISQLNKQLNLANEQLRDYAAVTEKMAETKERNRLAREIHDTLGHTLTGISAGLDACLTMLEISPEMTKKQLMVISDAARQGIKDIRRSVNKLRPDALERFELKEALDKLITDTMNVADVKIYFESRLDRLKFNEDEEVAVYRVVQESITNAIRHGKATEIQVKMEKNDGWLTLLIQDNGIGCKEINSGFGLKHMQERLELLNGSVTYNGENGFLVEARVPIRWGEDYD